MWVLLDNKLNHKVIMVSFILWSANLHYKWGMSGLLVWSSVLQPITRIHNMMVIGKLMDVLQLYLWKPSFQYRRISPTVLEQKGRGLGLLRFNFELQVSAWQYHNSGHCWAKYDCLYARLVTMIGGLPRFSEMECISLQGWLPLFSKYVLDLYVTDETVCYNEADQLFIIILLHLGPVQVKLLCLRVQVLCCFFQQLQAFLKLFLWRIILLCMQDHKI